MLIEDSDLGGEVERVRGELLLFGDVILPAFYRPGGLVPDRADVPRELVRIIHPPKDWRRAATRLIEALPAGPGRGDLPAPDRAAFRHLPAA